MSDEVKDSPSSVVSRPLFVPRSLDARAGTREAHEGQPLTTDH
jgi:hypothetical protein